MLAISEPHAVHALDDFLAGHHNVGEPIDRPVALDALHLPLGAVVQALAGDVVVAVALAVVVRKLAGHLQVILPLILGLLDPERRVSQPLLKADHQYCTNLSKEQCDQHQ